MTSPKPNPSLDRLTAEVAEEVTIMDSAATLIGGLAQQLRDNKNDPAAISALADSLDAAGTALGQAITDNTPAAEDPATPAAQKRKKG